MATTNGSFQMGVALGAALAASVAGAGAFETRSVPFAPTAEQIATVERLADAPAAPFAGERFAAPDGSTLPYRIAPPAATGPTAPLVLLLHGAGSMGEDNAAQLGPFVKAWAAPEIAGRYPAFVVAPQVAVRSSEYDEGDDGLRASRLGASLPAILALVEHLSGRLPIDRSRVYLVGFSMGASAALDAVTVEPERFAGVVAFSGVPPQRVLARLARTPALLVHGTRDESNPIDAARAWVAALSAAGAKPVFVTYEGMDHQVPPDTALAHDWRDWLFAQRLPPTPGGSAR